MSRFYRLFLISIFAALLVAVPASAAQGRQVYAFYFGWWLGDSWGDPTLSDRPANPYDQRDSSVIGAQIDQAKAAGIDAFIMSYYGPAGDNLTAQTFNALLDQAGARGFAAAAAVDLGSPNYNYSADAITQTLTYVVNDRANHPAYLRYNGKPVIYFWNQGRFSLSDWQYFRSLVDPGYNTIWVAEGTDTAYIGAFDGLYLFNVAWSSDFASTAAGWRQNVLGAGGTFFTPTVHPGWDENAIAMRDNRSNPTDVQARLNGEFLTNSWNGAASSGADAILIVSWNEYYENSHIEPSQAYGTQALDVLRPLIAGWKSGAPVGSSTANTNVAPAVEAAAPGTPTGQTFTLNYLANFRSGPSTGAGIISEIPYLAAVEVVGKNADATWIQVNYNGASGWVFGQLGYLSGDANALPVTG
jgi:hypothetical protein